MLTQRRFPGAKIFFVGFKITFSVVTSHLPLVKVTSMQPLPTQLMKAVVREPYIMITEARAEVPFLEMRESVEGQMV